MQFLLSSAIAALSSRIDAHTLAGPLGRSAFAFPQDVVSQGSKASPEMSNYQCSMTKDAACSAGRSLVERLCDGCRRRADGWTDGYAGSVVGCVWEAEGRAGALIVK